MKVLNKDSKRRDEILGIKEWVDMGGIMRIECITIDQMRELIDNDFLDLEEKQNFAPRIKYIYEFMKKYPDFEAHGYAVSPNRDDYRVSIEGVRLKRKATKEEYKEFRLLFEAADEISAINGEAGLFCWFD